MSCFINCDLQLLRKSRTAKPSVEVANSIRHMLQGIMKYRTTSDTLCWYMRSRSGGGVGYWQLVILHSALSLKYAKSAVVPYRLWEEGRWWTPKKSKDASWNFSLNSSGASRQIYSSSFQKNLGKCFHRSPSNAFCSRITSATGGYGSRP